MPPTSSEIAATAPSSTVKLCALAAAVCNSEAWLVMVYGVVVVADVTPSSWFSITVSSPSAALTESEDVASAVIEEIAPNPV